MQNMQMAYMFFMFYMDKKKLYLPITTGKYDTISASEQKRS